jgi:sugar/nucleoside kinase (ribokinase family)
MSVFVQGLGVIDAGLRAAAAAAFKCQRFGGRLGCPSAAELRAFMADLGRPWSEASLLPLPACL